MNPLIPLVIGTVFGAIIGAGSVIAWGFLTGRFMPKDSVAGLAGWTGPSQPGDGPTPPAAVAPAPERHRHRAPAPADHVLAAFRDWGVPR